LGCRILLLALVAFVPLLRRWLGLATDAVELMERASLDTGVVILDDMAG
jgi:hypothetical protein